MNERKEQRLPNLTLAGPALEKKASEGMKVLDLAQATLQQMALASGLVLKRENNVAAPIERTE
jgi:hypothetical protein